MRKQHIVVLADASGKTAGFANDLFNKKFFELLSSLRRNPCALESVWMAKAQFNREPTLLLAPTEIASVPDIAFTSRSSSPAMLGEATEWLAEQIARWVTPQSDNNLGDARPIVYIFLAGCPTDRLATRYGLERLRLSSEVFIFCLGETLAKAIAADFPPVPSRHWGDVRLSDDDMGALEIQDLESADAHAITRPFDLRCYS